MTCERCNLPVVFLGHDATAADHKWPPGREHDCCCGVELVCVFCESLRVARDGFLLVERPTELRAVATAGGLVH